MITWLTRALLALVLLIAVVFGALNGTIIELDFLFARWNLPLGVALLAFLAIGAGLGAAAAYLAFVPAIKARHRTELKQSVKAAAALTESKTS